MMTHVIMRLARPSAVKVTTVGMKRPIFVNPSMMTRMELKEEEGVRPGMESIVIEFQGHSAMERNLRGPYVAWCNGLAQAHTTQDPTYNLTIFVRPGQ
jgi:hypothetical protein